MGFPAGQPGSCRHAVQAEGEIVASDLQAIHSPVGLTPRERGHQGSVRLPAALQVLMNDPGALDPFINFLLSLLGGHD